MHEATEEVLPDGGRNLAEAGAMGAGMVAALLRELAGLLQRFLATGEHGSVDLLRLPISSADLHLLKHRLGRGEISVTIKAAGNSHIYETAYAGLWWVQHQDEAGNVVARSIEAADVPDMVTTHRADMNAAASTLIRELSGGEDA